MKPNHPFNSSKVPSRFGHTVDLPEIEREIYPSALIFNPATGKLEQDTGELASEHVKVGPTPVESIREARSAQLAPDPLKDIPKLDTTPPKPEPALPKSEEAKFNSALEAINDGTKYQPLTQFESPLVMLAYVDPRFQSTEFKPKSDVTLWNWQREALFFLSCGGKFTQDTPLIFNLCANNGSGKDAYIIAPLAVWHAITKIRSRCIITTSSHHQLKSQTEPSIRIIAHAINEWTTKNFGGPILIIKQFHIVCTTTHSEIRMFVTDEEGNVEGFHPHADWPNAEMLVILNEAKSITDDIYKATKRWTGFNRWLNISSSGECSGFFYKAILKSTPWTIKVPFNPDETYARKITSDECPHISQLAKTRDKIELGENSAIYRSIYLSEFTTLDESVIITKEALQKCISFPPPHVLKTELGCGIDLALGGDETTMWMRVGNKPVASHYFRDRDSVSTAQRVILQLDEWRSIYNLQAHNVYADDGGLSRSIIDIMKYLNADRWGDINRVHNQSPAIRKDIYGNRGGELWFVVKRLIEMGVIPMTDEDTRLIEQLTTRYCRISKTNFKLFLESKIEAKAKGHGSPDRADAFVLSFCGIDIEEYLLSVGIRDTSVSQEKKERRNALGQLVKSNSGKGMNVDQVEEYLFNRSMGKREERVSNNLTRAPLNNSLSELMRRMRNNSKQKTTRFNS